MDQWSKMKRVFFGIFQFIDRSRVFLFFANLATCLWIIFSIIFHLRKMFNKPKRNFRSRKRDSESEEEVLSDDSEAKDVTKTTALSAAKSGQLQQSKAVGDTGKKKSDELKAVSSANSLLSFVSNEDGMSNVRCYY